MENSKSNYLTGYCPHCFSQVNYDANSSIVTCISCDNKIPTSQLKKTIYDDTIHSQPSTSNSYFASAISPAQAIDTSESGLAYVETFFEQYDWLEFSHTTQLYIGKILEMVE